MKTRSDVITRALRRLRIVAMDEVATADQEQAAGEALDALRDELERGYGVLVPDLSHIEDEIFLPLAYLLAAEVAPDFSVALPEPRSRALIRLRAVTNPNDYIAPNATDYF